MSGLMNGLDRAASNSGELDRKTQCSMDALVHGEVIDRIYQMGGEHAAVMHSIRRGNGLHNNRPTVSRIGKETGLEKSRIEEILDDIKHLIEESAVL